MSEKLLIMFWLKMKQIKGMLEKILELKNSKDTHVGERPRNQVKSEL